MSNPTAARASSSPATGLHRAFQVLTVLAVVNVLYQSITAGQLFSSDGGPVEAHGAGAIVLHVITGLAAIVAVLLWRRNQLSLAMAALAAVVFVYTFVQAAIGGYQTLYVHVPGAMLLAVGTAWLAFAAFRLRRR